MMDSKEEALTLARLIFQQRRGFREQEQGEM